MRELSNENNVIKILTSTLTYFNIVLVFLFGDTWCFSGDIISHQITKAPNSHQFF